MFRWPVNAHVRHTDSGPRTAGLSRLPCGTGIPYDAFESLTHRRPCWCGICPRPEPDRESKVGSTLANHGGRQPTGIESVGRRRATIHDVARLAGVSRQTVSRAVNDKEEIDATTKARILDAVRTLEYRPSRYARGLARQGSTTLGLVVSELTNPYFPEVAAGVLDIAEQRGWQVVVTQSRIDAQ